MIRLQTQRLVITAHRLSQVALSTKCISQVVVRIEIVRIELECTLDNRRRLLEFSLILECIAQVAVGLGVVGLDLNGPSQACSRYVDLPLRLKGDTQVVQGFDVLRVELEHPRITRHRKRDVSLKLIDATQSVPGFDKGGLSLGEPLKMRSGTRQIAELKELPADRQHVLGRGHFRFARHRFDCDGDGQKLREIIPLTRTRRGHYFSTSLFRYPIPSGRRFLLRSTISSNSLYVQSRGLHPMSEPRTIERESLLPRLERAREFAARQVRSTIERNPGFFPIYTRNGRWRHDGEGWTDWCAGFHAGMMWLLAERPIRPGVAAARRRIFAPPRAEAVRPQRARPGIHLLEYVSSLVSHHRRAPFPRGIDHGRSHARLAVQRRRPLSSLVRRTREPLYRHHDERAAHFLRRHAPVAILLSIRWPSHTAIPPRSTLVRADGSTAHEGIFDPDTGAVPSPVHSSRPARRFDLGTRPGVVALRLRDGFQLHRTRIGFELLPCSNADCYISRCPEGLVPPWDFDVPPGPDRIDDSSAAAIAASGLWDLAALVESREPARAQRYRNATLTILDSLCSDRYLAWNTPGWEGVLKHAVYHFHKKLGVDESVMWGDFFFLEAVHKVLQTTP